MRCVKDCYFKSYVRTENKSSGFYCELYEKRLEKKEIGTKKHGNVTLFEIVRCKECEDKETLYYSKKMNVFQKDDITKCKEKSG